MISKLHARLGTAGLIVAVIALLAALGGGAYAASGGLTGKQKKEVEKIAKRVGKPGPAGPQGVTGPPGADGDAGATGANGANGAAGSNGKEGAVGQPGDPWTPDSQLPAGATETGTWGFRGKFSATTAPIVALSFPIRLAAPLAPTKVHLISSNGQEIVINEGDGSREQQTPTAGCAGGTVAVPVAESGNLCVYSQTSLTTLGPETFIGSNLIHAPASSCEGLGCLAGFGGPGAGAGVSGALVGVAFEAEESAKAWGTWAVTG